MKVYNGTIDCVAEEVGYDSTRLDAVNNFFARMIENNIIFGVSYRLARKGQVFASASLGSRHYTNPELPMMPDTVFNLASQTKQFTAVAMFMLAGDGLISIDDKVGQYLPQFDSASYNEITILHMLTHTSGLYPHEGLIPEKHHMGMYEHMRIQYEKDGKDTDWISAGLRAGMRCKPGTEWQYCSFGLSVLAVILGKITGDTYQNFVINNIIKPLGMKNTTFDPTPEMARDAIVFNSWTEKFLSGIQNGVKQEENIWTLMPPAGSGVYSTTEDMIRLGIMLGQWGRFNDTHIIGRKAVEVMSTQRLFNIPDNCWGSVEKDRKYGVGMDMRHFPCSFTSKGTFFHEGAGQSVTIIDPVEEMVCTCVYPWVNNVFNADCNGRLYNVMWSGLK